MKPTQTKTYLLGYSWGVEIPNVQGDNRFFHEKTVKRCPMTGGRAIAHKEAVVYKTKELALRDALKHKAETQFPDNRVFVHAARYETHNPANAKGLKLWDDSIPRIEYI